MITLLLGGARSGKSAIAERLATQGAGGGAVTYVATGSATDADMAARIATHRDRRPTGWVTLEVSGQNLPPVLRSATGMVLLDALGTWLVAFEEDFAADPKALCDALRDRDGDTVVVSEEVGLGVHPSTAAGRRFRDALGELNQAVAAIADEVLLIVAGRALSLEQR